MIRRSTRISLSVGVCGHGRSHNSVGDDTGTLEQASALDARPHDRSCSPVDK